MPRGGRKEIEAPGVRAVLRERLMHKPGSVEGGGHRKSLEKFL